MEMYLPTKNENILVDIPGDSEIQWNSKQIRKDGTKVLTLTHAHLNDLSIINRINV